MTRIIERNASPRKRIIHELTVRYLVAVVLIASAGPTLAQLSNTAGVDSTLLLETLPRAPMPTATPDQTSESSSIFAKPTAPTYASFIEPDYNPQRLTAAGKVKFAGSEIVSIDFPVSVLVSAGISHGLNSDPKYGTNSEAFAKRVGAAGARDSSQIVFSDALLATLVRQDPRYYVAEPGHRFITRFAYAASRVLISRTDAGHSTINIAELAGYGGSAALTQLYYPRYNRSRETMFSTYGYSLVGLAVQDEIHEFIRFVSLGQRK